MNLTDIRCPWGDTLTTCAITVADLEGIVIYQNERSIAVNGDVRGRSMLPCHSERSRQIIERLITNAENNVYTIEKRGLRKMIYQTPWYAEGKVAGLVEFSLEIPESMPHYVRE